MSEPLVTLIIKRGETPTLPIVTVEYEVNDEMELASACIAGAMALLQIGWERAPHRALRLKFEALHRMAESLGVRTRSSHHVDRYNGG